MTNRKLLNLIQFSMSLVLAYAMTAHAQTQKVLHSFTGGWDGAYPDGGVIFDPAGNLYGVASAGGNPFTCMDSSGCGMVYRLTPEASDEWQETALFRFTSSATGAAPEGSLYLDAAGNLFGTTTNGGKSSLCGGAVLGCGVAFELASTSTDMWQESVLQALDGGAKGGVPAAGFVADASGSLYSTTMLGGTYGHGNVFQLSLTASGWQEKVLHSFTGGHDGSGSNSTLVFDAAGNLYGTTISGGDLSGCSGNGCGVVFELSPTSSGAWKETVVHDFSGQRDGSSPAPMLVFDAVGNLYGATSTGGNLAGCLGYGCGVVFKLSGNSTTGWKETVLHTFTGNADGAHPSVVLIDASQTLYGAAGTGGNTSDCVGYGGCGLIFKLVPTTGGIWKEGVLYTFTGADGALPSGFLSMDTSGNLYGTTQQGGTKGLGVVFEVTP